MEARNHLRIKAISNQLRRTILTNRTPFIAMALFMILGIFLTDSVCVFRSITGVPCPGCGLTRAGISLFNLDFSKAFEYHPLIFLIIPIILLVIFLIVFRKYSFEKLTVLFISIGVVMVVVYVIRMIVFFPMQEPMTYNSNSLFARFFHIARNIFNVL